MPSTNSFNGSPDNSKTKVLKFITVTNPKAKGYIPKPFGPGRWIIYTLSFLICGFIAIGGLKSGAIDFLDFNQYKPTIATVTGTRYNSGCTQGQSGYFGSSVISQSSYGLMDRNSHAAYYLNCVGDLTIGQQVRVYAKHGSQDVYTDRQFILTNGLGNLVMGAIFAGAVLYFGRGLVKHKV
jgi:hypothetical protein